MPHANRIVSSDNTVRVQSARPPTCEHYRDFKESILDEQSRLIVYCDGHKSQSDLRSVAAVRSYCSNLTGFLHVETHFQDENQGLSKSVICGVTEVVERFGRAIVLEDDLTNSRFFFEILE